MTAPIWSVQCDAAELMLPPWRARLHCGDLQQGLQDLRCGAAPIQLSNLLQLRSTSGEPAPVVTEVYARGSRLFLVAGATESWPVRWELCWNVRGDVPGDALCIDLQVSAQTPLLDAAPWCELSTVAPGASIEVLPHPAAAENPLAFAVLRLMGSTFSLLQMVDVSDFCGLEHDQVDDGLRVRFPLFWEHLEKGVLRRARVRAMLLPGDIDLEQARAQYEAFAAEAPNLSS